MIEITINLFGYNVLFRVYWGFPDKRKFQKNQKRTICQIFGKNLDTDSEFVQVSKGIAFCNQDAGDSFNKFEGKKVSLQKALEVFKNKEHREQFWLEFKKLYNIQ